MKYHGNVNPGDIVAHITTPDEKIGLVTDMIEWTGRWVAIGYRDDRTEFSYSRGELVPFEENKPPEPPVWSLYESAMYAFYEGFEAAPDDGDNHDIEADRAWVASDAKANLTKAMRLNPIDQGPDETEKVCQDALVLVEIPTGRYWDMGWFNQHEGEWRTPSRDLTQKKYIGWLPLPPTDLLSTESVTE